MNIYQIIKMALKSLASNKKRAFLTMLGVMIGIGAVIGIMAIMQGATNNITERFNNIGANLINAVILNRSDSNRKVTYAKIKQFEEENKDIIKAVLPSLSGSVIIKYKNDSVNTNIDGVLPLYKEVRNVEIEEGRFVTDLDVSQKEKVAIIGSYIKNKYFSKTSAIGKQIKLNGQLYKVVGVAQEKSTGGEYSSDNNVFIPYTSAVRLLKNARITAFSVAIYSNDDMQEAVERVESFLFRVYKDEDAYYVTDPRQISESLNSVLGILAATLVGIAGISLVVGGVGIMNIMLVSVTERTREIGIRKAIGASKRSIMLQFLVEAGLLSGLGGVFGILLGKGIAKVVCEFIKLTPEVTIKSIVVSVAFSVGIGMFFGWSPANKAAKLKPIDALRTE
ncbi:MAG: ABC transporter permease [Clostridiales bacterium]|nr:ABC transporter permease [Clostridiales bacterium]